MSHVLVIQASPRGERSHSRRLAERFVDAYQAAHPGVVPTRREVGRAGLPHIGEAFVAAAFHPDPQARPLSMQADLALSDLLADELLAHDRLVIATPMYNFSVPSGLKAWIDHVVRLGRTVDLVSGEDGMQYRPRVQGHKVLIVTTRGGQGFGSDGENAAMNHADTLLRTALGFIGIEDVTVVAAEGEEGDARVFQAACRAAEEQLVELARNF